MSTNHELISNFGLHHIGLTTCLSSKLEISSPKPPEGLYKEKVSHNVLHLSTCICVFR